MIPTRPVPFPSRLSLFFRVEDPIRSYRNQSRCVYLSWRELGNGRNFFRGKHRALGHRRGLIKESAVSISPLLPVCIGLLCTYIVLHVAFYAPEDSLRLGFLSRFSFVLALMFFPVESPRLISEPTPPGSLSQSRR